MGTPLRNPPVYFTVAQVRFNPILNLGEFLPAIQDAFRRARFSDFVRHPTPVINITEKDGQPVPVVQVKERFSFGNAEKTHGFLLDESSLTLQSTDYGTFQDFSEQFLRGLARVHEIVQLDFVARVGLRYLDHVAPLANDDLSDYLCRESLGLTMKLEGEAQYSFCETRMSVEDITLLSRVMTRIGALGFPPDLAPLGLDVAARFMFKPECLHATLDNDAFIEKRESFSTERVLAHLDSLHTVISKAFWGLVSPHAREMWNR